MLLVSIKLLATLAYQAGQSTNTSTGVIVQPVTLTIILMNVLLVNQINSLMVNHAITVLTIALLAPNIMEFAQLAPPPSQFKAAPIHVVVRLALFSIRLRINALLRPIALQAISYN